MSDVIAYVTYHLLCIGRDGYQPNDQAGASGMGFDGGYYTRGSRMMGYLTGDANNVEITLANLTAWRVAQLNQAEALAWADAALVTNTQTPEGQYYGPATVEADGRISKPLSDTEWV